MNTEIRKLETSIIQDYVDKILSKRIECYPEVFELLSNFLKMIRREFAIKPEGEKIIQKSEVIKFINDYDRLNSKVSLFFSVTSEYTSFTLRDFLYDLIEKTKEKEIKEEEIVNLIKSKVSDLEVNLKNDVGIYIIDFKDSQRMLKLKNYEDIRIMRDKALNNT